MPCCILGFFFNFFGRFEFLKYFFYCLLYQFTVYFINLLFALLFALSIYCARVDRRLSLGGYKYDPPVPHSPASASEGKRREKGEERREKREERREKREEKEEKE